MATRSITGVVKRTPTPTTTVKTSTVSRTTASPPRTIRRDRITAPTFSGSTGTAGGGSSSSSSAPTPTPVPQIIAPVITNQIIQQVIKPRSNQFLFKKKRMTRFIKNPIKKKRVRCPLDPRFFLGDPRCKLKRKSKGRKKK